MFQEICLKIHDLEMELTIFYRKCFKQFLDYQENTNLDNKNKNEPVENMCQTKKSFLDLTVEDLEYNTKQDESEIKKRNCVGVQTEDMDSQPTLITNYNQNRFEDHQHSDSYLKHLTGLDISLMVSTSEDEDYMLSESEESISPSEEISVLKTKRNDRLNITSSGIDSLPPLVNKPAREQVENEKDMRSQGFTGNVRYSYSVMANGGNLSLPFVDKPSREQGENEKELRSQGCTSNSGCSYGLSSEGGDSFPTFVNNPAQEQVQNEKDIRSQGFSGNVRYSYSITSKVRDSSLLFLNKPSWQHVENEKDMRSQSFTGNVKYSYGSNSKGAVGSTTHTKSNICPLILNNQNYINCKENSDIHNLEKSENLLQNNGTQMNLNFSKSEMLRNAHYEHSEMSHKVCSSPYKISTCILTGDKEIDEEIISFYKQRAIQIESM